jgi:hypothetical protein
MEGTMEPTRQAFYHARQRCNDPKNESYHNYGGRGIKFRFKSFGDFIVALQTPENPSGLKPSHRINNDGHYEPEHSLGHDEPTTNQ